ncbi:Scr1 family TA system antitoxin-like transcriptional regulator [Saccharopolyspora sp. NFXS83]|uniref:Scr1 family TA system antitoxin-like transcriptional regulator n=1 Tax=Saccharopolyspora sp. NFXS83 TaxID=2993560 RepID=UPI003A4E114A
MLDGSFTLFELAGGTAYAFTESQGFAVCLTEPADLKPAVETCRRLDEVALAERESVDLITQAAERLTGG